MYLFEAKYINMETDEEITRKIEFDGDNFFDTEKECYLYAMDRAYSMAGKCELLACLEIISC